MLFSLLLLCGSALGADYRITSVTQFMNFASSVNSGTTYAGTTVYLDVNINLSGKTLTPIGNAAKQFRGTFDGQGHIISNLKMTQALRYVGLFGYSDGAAFKNVVLEKTSSITSTCTDQVMPRGLAYLGGIVAYCGTESGPCTIENVINLAKVSFTGSLYDYERMYMGGIAGCLNVTNNEINVKNCANYETVSYYCSGSYCFTGPALFGKSLERLKEIWAKKSKTALTTVMSLTTELLGGTYPWEELLAMQAMLLTTIALAVGRYLRGQIPRLVMKNISHLLSGMPFLVTRASLIAIDCTKRDTTARQGMETLQSQTLN